MRLFADRIKSTEPIWTIVPREARIPYDQWLTWTQQLRSDFLPKAPVFEISNVADYYYRGTDQEYWDLFKDFPRPRPPFDPTWFEWKVPAHLFSEGKYVESPASRLFSRLGCIAAFSDADDRAPANVKYTLNLVPFGLAVKPNIIESLPALCLALDENLEGVEVVPGKKVGYAFVGYDTKYQQGEISETLLTFANNTSGMINVAMLAMSLLNCKNVTTRRVDLPLPLQKKHRANGHNFTPSHHIIEIQPITEAIRRETGEIGYSRKAASIVRGHFKDYSKGNGLFGKVKGQFWWPQRLTGIPDVEYRLKSAIGSLDDGWRKS